MNEPNNNIDVQNVIVQEQPYAAAQIVAEPEQPNTKYLIGFIGALLGALIGAVPWAVASYFGWFVGWLGFLIGFLSIKGYEILGGKKGKMKIVIVCLTTVLGVFMGNIAGDVMSVWKELSELGVSLGESIQFYFEILGEPEVINDFLINLGLGLVFAALGVFGLFKEMVDKSKGNNIDMTPQVITMNANGEMVNVEPVINTEEAQKEEAPAE